MPYRLSVLRDDGESCEPFNRYDPAVEDMAGFLSGVMNEMLNTYIKAGVTVYGAKALELCTLSSSEDPEQIQFVIEYLTH